MNNDTLASLPDDIFLDIVQHLGSARDIAHLGAVSRRANNLVERDGWVPFVRRHFPSLNLPPVEPGQWRGLADRLTYLDKCWEKRGFVISEYLEKQAHGRGQPPMGKQSVAASTVVNAALLVSEQKECVAWGCGENLVVMSMPCHGKHAHRKRRWRELHGASQGYRPGNGDITALSIIDREGAPQLAVGRADGSLRLQSLSHADFGQESLDLEQPVTKGLRGQRNGSLPSPGQTAVSWTEYHAQSNLLATGQSSTVALYNVIEDDTSILRPVHHLSLSASNSGDLDLVRSVKFLSKDTIAIGFGGSQKPLRLTKVTPDGLRLVDLPPQGPRAQYALLCHRGLNSEESKTVRAIQPVGPPSRGDLLLSAWDDGTYRLKDIRTPSTHDAIYANQLVPYEAGSSLLVYGTERFVAGSNSRPNLCFFDFRQPKQYHWTTAAACSGKAPYPEPPKQDDDQLASHVRDTCEPGDRKMCLWHSASLTDQYRPDAALMIGDRNSDRVHSLAKASDASQSFWTGLRGSVFETRLTLAEDTKVPNVRSSAPNGWTAGKPASKIMLAETGSGLRDSADWSDQTFLLNLSDWDFRFRAGRVKAKEKRARLDPSVAVFKQGSSRTNGSRRE